MGIPGDPPQRTPGGRIELEQERYEEQQQQFTHTAPRCEECGMMGCSMEQHWHKQQIQGMHTALQGTQNAITVLHRSVLLPVVEAGRSGYGEQPVEHHAERGKVVGRISHADRGHESPCEERRSSNGHTREEQPLQRGHDGGVLELDPSELQRRPDADEEGGLGAEEQGEGGERQGGGGRGGEGGGEEEGDVGSDQRRPDGEEGALAQLERVEEVGRGEADGEDGEDGEPAEVEEEGRSGDQRGREARVVGERRARGGGRGRRRGAAGPRAAARGGAGPVGAGGGGGEGNEGLRGGGGVAALVVVLRRGVRGRGLRGGAGGEGRGGKRRRDEEAALAGRGSGGVHAGGGRM